MRKALLLPLLLWLGFSTLPRTAFGIPSTDNLLTNPGFDTDLSGWFANPGVAQWSDKDILGSPNSGSALIQNADTSGSTPYFAQCVQLPGAGPYDLGGRFFIPSGQGQTVGARALLWWYSNTTCSVPALNSTILFPTAEPTPTDSWTGAVGLRVTPAAGAVSALVAFQILKLESPSGPTVEGYLDGAFFRPTTCTPADNTLCLHGGRFRVNAEWETLINGETNGGQGHAVQFNDDSGYFYFFDPDNTEVVVKMHAACVDPWNDYWVFAAGLTNVFVSLNIEDTVAGVVNHYVSPQGTAFQPLQITSGPQAFNTCP